MSFQKNLLQFKTVIRKQKRFLLNDKNQYCRNAIALNPTRTSRNQIGIRISRITRIKTKSFILSGRFGKSGYRVKNLCFFSTNLTSN
jgi:hypothetical protein